jgi:hypothetical protein
MPSFVRSLWKVNVSFAEIGVDLRFAEMWRVGILLEKI